MGTIEVDKMTVKVTIIASGVAALILFLLTALWGHQTDITLLKTNQVAVMKTVESYTGVPAQLSRIATLLEANERDHLVIMRKLERR